VSINAIDTRAKLLEAIHAIQERNSAEWFAKLDERKHAEAGHHDQQRDAEIRSKLTETQFAEEHGNKKFYLTTEKSKVYVDSWLAERVREKVALDFACGNGLAVVKFAKMGAKMAIGIDISEVSIRNAKALAEREGVLDRCYFLQADCENTGLPDASVDVLLCSGVLHHMDLSYAFPEMRRILVPGGSALAVEALGYNPLIRLYRKLTPKMRTEWEKDHILSIREVAFAKRFFLVEEPRFWHLFSIGATWFRHFPVLFKLLLAAGNGLDGVVLRIPLVRRMAWQFTFVMIRK
jgi:SAM-dependent methyltransferase